MVAMLGGFALVPVHGALMLVRRLPYRTDRIYML
jgi:hypothetical protein